MGLFLVTPYVGLCSDLNIRKGDEKPFEVGSGTVGDNKGPTLIMSYRKSDSGLNPIASFMYFVPLIAPTRVDNISSLNNGQQLEIISHHVIIDSTSFSLTCGFDVSGRGFHMNRFDSAGMIAANADTLKKGKPLKHMLDYIRISGSCFGLIEVKGSITGSARTVTEVIIHFNAKGKKSPVTIGLYDVRPDDGLYKYEHRINEVVARVNSLIFKKTEGTPRMGIDIASITAKNGSDSLFSRIKGAIANVFITPPKVSVLGNTTMLEFGRALLQNETEFTFPKADNINEIKTAEPDTL